MNLIPLKLVSGWQTPAHLALSTASAPLMLKAEFTDGKWCKPEVLPFIPQIMVPDATTTRISRSVQESIKVCWVDNNRASAFRLNAHAYRFNASAGARGLPPLPEHHLKDAVQSLVGEIAHVIPRKTGTALYLHPIILGTETDVSEPARKAATFMLLAFRTEVSRAGPMSVWVQVRSRHASSDGLGGNKPTASVAGPLTSVGWAKAQGYKQILWCQPDTGNIEELDGMNLFAVIGDRLVTPRISDRSLAGITRDSIIRLLTRTGMAAEERDISFNTLKQSIYSGACREVFGCSTAAITLPIKELADANGSLSLPDVGYPVCADLYAQLLDIQEGRALDTECWMTPLA